jgi:hypothetical protein
MATKSTKEHERINSLKDIFPCSSVDFVAIISIFFWLKDCQPGTGVPSVNSWNGATRRVTGKAHALASTGIICRQKANEQLQLKSS